MGKFHVQESMAQLKPRRNGITSSRQAGVNVRHKTCNSAAFTTLSTIVHRNGPQSSDDSHAIYMRFGHKAVNDTQRNRSIFDGNLPNKHWPEAKLGMRSCNSKRDLHLCVGRHGVPNTDWKPIYFVHSI
jgi:hypothetical protein